MFKGVKVSLRAVERADVDSLFAFVNDPALFGCRYLDEDAPPMVSTRYLDRTIEKWQDATKALHPAVIVDGACVGYASLDYGWDTLTPFIAVVIAPEHRRSGYGSEAARLLIEYSFKHLPSTALHSWISDWNEPALRFSEALGFTPAGRVRRDAIHKGRFSDSIPVELLREEWEPPSAP